MSTEDHDGTTKVARMASPVLKALPFRCSQLAEVANLEGFCAALPGPFGMPEFFGQLQRYENVLLSVSTTSQASQDLLGSLGITVDMRDGGKVVGSDSIPQWQPKAASRLCSLICAYLLVDAAIFFNFPNVYGTPIQRRRPAKSLALGYFEQTLLPKLTSTRDILKGFRKIVAQKDNKVITGITNDVPQVRLLKYLAGINESGRKAKILENFVGTAMHIAVLRETHFGREDLPDIPDSLDIGILGQLEEHEGDFLQRVKKHDGGANSFRSALQCSLLISPLCLLLPNHRDQNFWSTLNVCFGRPYLTLQAANQTR
ncbi:hypothetical protein GALMADRAFT_149181 [Galerina marginata CBS 339.88]|uniref:Uncharacterized protein n=1 Tax=Galerina marginata (strain CBS 339.88) TaxID=685588 RepID=A0A067S250_GALM3|nr:hypothetical protein GALMADRAFT_149181 [Galerina marginata CBS 339.88]